MQAEGLATENTTELGTNNRRQWVKPTVLSSSLSTARQGSTIPSADAANGFS